MRAHRPLHFDGLEARQLLTQVVPTRSALMSLARRLNITGPEAQVTPKPVGPVRLDGQLAVSPAGAHTTTDATGMTTRKVPVRGQLGDVGAVRGTWTRYQSQDGQAIPYQRLDLRNAHGSLVVAFQSLTLAQATGASASGSPGSTGDPHAAVVTITPQHVATATGALQGAALETGTITLRSDPSGQRVNQITLKTTDQVRYL